MSHEELIKKIKAKKELAGISNEFVSEILKKELNKSKVSNSLSKKEEKLIIKSVRAQLRKFSGQFIKKSDYIKKIDSNNIDELLKAHASTNERLDFYPELKNLIKKHQVTSIIDLGCGLNPLAIADNKIIYHAYDI